MPGYSCVHASSESIFLCKPPSVLYYSIEGTKTQRLILLSVAIITASWESNPAWGASFQRLCFFPKRNNRFLNGAAVFPYRYPFIHRMRFSVSCAGVHQFPPPPVMLSATERQRSGKRIRQQNLLRFTPITVVLWQYGGDPSQSLHFVSRCSG